MEGDEFGRGHNGGFGLRRELSVIGVDNRSEVEMGEFTGEEKGGLLDLSNTEPAQADVPVLRHDWETVTYVNGKGIEIPRLSCKNPGCDKQNKPLFVKARSMICKKGRRRVVERFGVSIA